MSEYTRGNMGELIILRDWYEQKRNQILNRYKDTDHPELRLRFANELSRLESRWQRLNKQHSQKLVSHG